MLLRFAVDTWNSRRNLEVYVPPDKSWAYYKQNDATTGKAVYADGSESDSRLVVEFPIFADNKSARDDSIISLQLFLDSRSAAVHARYATDEGAEFFAQQVQKHSLEVILVRFSFDHGRYGKSREWSVIDRPGELEALLEVKTGRGKTKRLTVTATPVLGTVKGHTVLSPFADI